MTRYEIRVKCSSARDWTDWFRELKVQATGEGGQELPDWQTLPDLLLIGDLPDQSALLGVLMRLHNLNLTILTVRKIEEGIKHDR